MIKTQVLILDFGSQYTQLLARRVREANVYLKDAYQIDEAILDLPVAILGVCYGMQLLTNHFQRKVELANKQEFGKSTLYIDQPNNKLFTNIVNKSEVWMSHADHVTKIPKNFIEIAHSDNAIAEFAHLTKPIYGIQFHAEVTHSAYGKQMIANFLFAIANCTKDWSLDDFITKQIVAIKNEVQNKQVILGLSGVVDSSVAAAIIAKAIGKQLTCIFVDTGLLRKNEAIDVMKTYQENFTLNLIMFDASKQFFLLHYKGLKILKKKEKLLANNLLMFLLQQQKKFKTTKFLAQGTIYPDIIESSSKEATSKTIKTHHNVDGLPNNLQFKLLEPLKTLFKDEVRAIGLQLGLPATLINRHPFPGPGLGVRVIEEVTKEKYLILQEVDDIFISKLKVNNLYHKVLQAFATLLPVKTVGVMGDNRTYDYVVSLRSVSTIDFMTAISSHLLWEFLDEVANEIINKVSGVNRVVYDITSKPPGTIEWE